MYTNEIMYKINLIIILIYIKIKNDWIDSFIDWKKNRLRIKSKFESPKHLFPPFKYQLFAVY